MSRSRNALSLVSASKRGLHSSTHTRSGSTASITLRTSSTERCDTCAVPTTKYFVSPWSSVVTEEGSSTSPPYHMLFTQHDRDSRTDPDRARSRGVSPSHPAFPRADRRPEPRRDEPRRVLP